MYTVRNSNLSLRENEPECRRRHGRLRCDDLRIRVGKALLGKVADMSASGLRVKRRGAMHGQVGDVVQASLEIGDASLTIAVKIAWIKRERFRRYSIGLTFESVSDTDRKAISEIARLAQPYFAIAKAHDND